MFGNESFFQILDNINDGIFFVNKRFEIIYWNKGAEKISGYSESEALWQLCSKLLSHTDFEENSLCKDECFLAATIKDGVSRMAQVFLNHKGGNKVPINISTGVLKDGAGKISGGYMRFSEDLFYRFHKNKMKEFENLAFLDGITRLVNNHFLKFELDTAIKESNKFSQRTGIFLIDVDFLEKINNEFGWETGDRVLGFIGNTLLVNCRSFDIFGRWDKDEFLGIIRQANEVNLVSLGERIRLLVEEAYTYCGEKKISATISIGATLIQKNDSFEKLLGRANKLLKESKKKGKNRLTFG